MDYEQYRVALTIVHQAVVSPDDEIVVGVAPEVSDMVAGALGESFTYLDAVSPRTFTALADKDIPLQWAWYVSGGLLVSWGALLDLVDLWAVVGEQNLDGFRANIVSIVNLAVRSTDCLQAYTIVAGSVASGLLEHAGKVSVLLAVSPENVESYLQGIIKALHVVLQGLAVESESETDTWTSGGWSTL